MKDYDFLDPGNWFQIIAVVALWGFLTVIVVSLIG